MRTRTRTHALVICCFCCGCRFVVLSHKAGNVPQLAPLKAVGMAMEKTGTFVVQLNCANLPLCAFPANSLINTSVCSLLCTFTRHGHYVLRAASVSRDSVFRDTARDLGPGHCA